MTIRPFQQRMAELWTIQTHRDLDDSETMEFTHCMMANAKYCWEMAQLENLSVIAALCNDVKWQHEICQDIEALEATGTISGNKNKPSNKKKQD